MKRWRPILWTALVCSPLVTGLLMGATGNEAARQVVAGNTAFALDLYARLARGSGNLFFSPYSLSTALAMTYGGARENTAAQMSQVLHFDPDQARLHAAFAQLQAGVGEAEKEGHLQLRVANSLWPQKAYPFLPEFLELAKRHYGVTITPCDYVGATEASRQTINAWAEEQTRKKIQDLIPRGVLTPLTRLVLANAIYFKGNWVSRFDPKLTQTAPFQVAPQQTVPAPLMFQKRSFGYVEFEDLQALAMDYQGRALSLVVLLPRQPDGLNALERNLTAANLAKWTTRLPPREVEVYFPKFKLACPFRLDAELAAMGMSDAFDESRADFSGLDGRKQNLYISAVLHKAFVEMNEEGTEAAAASAVVIGLTSSGPRTPPVFRADHPFLFLIRDNRTGSLLFLGRLSDPSR